MYNFVLGEWLSKIIIANFHAATTLLTCGKNCLNVIRQPPIPAMLIMQIYYRSNIEG